MYYRKLMVYLHSFLVTQKGFFCKILVVLECVGFLSFELKRQKVSRIIFITVLLLVEVFPFSFGDSVCEWKKKKIVHMFKSPRDSSVQYPIRRQEFPK